MPRIAQVVAPGMAHHVTQRGNRRMESFLCEDDYAVYMQLMAQSCARHKVAVWTYCL